MDTPKRSNWHTAPQGALRNVSNGQSFSIRGSSSYDWRSTPTKESQGVLSASAKRMKLSIRREISKSYGDLSNLRPISPPIQNLPTRLHELHRSPGKHVDDTRNLFSASYNRQARRAIPNDWVTGASGIHPSTTSERSVPTGQQIYHNPLYSICFPHHVEAESAKISIEGLTSGYVQPQDFCVPVTRSHPGDVDQRLQAATSQNVAVEHINISTVWNGLSDVNANELFRVHQAFVTTLEKMLSKELWQIYQQLQQPDSAGNISPIHTLFSTGIVRGISFCRNQLVSEMAETLYCSKENTAKAKSGFLRLFLVTTDALVHHQEDSSRDTSVTIRMRCDPLSSRPYPIVDAAWVPDFLIFEGLDKSPLEGQCFSVIPKYCSKSAFRPTQFPKNVKYSIESESRHSPLSWLVWDDEIAGFKGRVPFYSEVNGYDRSVANISRECYENVSHSLRIIVQAVLVDDNGSSIRYERILRARLTINVVPWYVNSNYWESNEQSSIPKAYQDARLASAIKCFARQDIIGGSCHPGQSPSRLPQRRNKAHLCIPTNYARTGQVGARDSHSAMGSSATGARIKDTDLSSLAGTQAYLIAKYARMIRELEQVKEQIMMSTSIGEHHETTLHAPNPEHSVQNTNCVPLNPQTGQNQHTGPFSLPCISCHALEELTTPSSPTFHGGDDTSQLGPIAMFTALPPPAIGLRACSKSNFQIKDRNTLDTTRTGWNLIPTPRTTSQSAALEGLTTQNTHSPLETDYLWRLPDQASIFPNNTNAAFSSPSKSVGAFSPPPLVKGELAGVSTPGKHGCIQQPRPSASNISPFERFEKTEKEQKQETRAYTAKPDRNTLSLLNSEDQGSGTPTQRSGGVIFNPFSPLRNLRSSTTLASQYDSCSHASERGASTYSSKNIKHLKLDSGYYMHTNPPDSDKVVEKTVPASSGFEDDGTMAESFLSNSFSSERSGQLRLRQTSLPFFSPRHISTNSTSGSCSTSSEMEIIVEQDPRARGVSRQEQAKAWKLLSRSEKNNGDQLGHEKNEVRLSEDEKKAMDEAMQRSLNDLAQGFDDIFLEDSSESNSGDGDL